MADDKYILTTRDVVKRFGGLTAVNKMTVDIERGRIFSIIGPNGAGKTTFFNAISALYQPEEGTIEFEGRRIDRLKPYQITGLAHGPHLPEHPPVRGHDRGGEHHGRRLHPAQAETWQAVFRTRAFREEEARPPGPGHRSSWSTWA